MRRAIGFAAWGWPLADPDSLLATSGVADRAMWPIATVAKYGKLYTGHVLDHLGKHGAMHPSIKPGHRRSGCRRRGARRFAGARLCGPAVTVLGADWRLRFTAADNARPGDVLVIVSGGAEHACFGDVTATRWQTRRRRTPCEGLDGTVHGNETMSEETKPRVDGPPTLPDMHPVARLVHYEERAEDVNKDIALARRGNPVGVLSGATRGDLARSVRWRDILGPYGFADELRVACVDAHGCWGHLRLYRDAGERPFSAAAADLLRALVPTIASALRRATVQPLAARDLPPLAPAIVVLDQRLAVRSWTRAAGHWFAAFVGERPPRGANARCAIFSAASRFLAQGAAASAQPARARLRLADGRWVAAEAARLSGEDCGIAVTVRAATTSDVLDLLVRAHGLTPRERELVALLVDGLDTRDAARRLAISHYTVQQHLKAVFDKVGVRSRRELVTRIFASGA